MWSTLTLTSLFSPHLVIQVWSNQSSYAGTKWTHWRIFRSPLSQRPVCRCGPANAHASDAPEPATPMAAAPTPARLSSSRLVTRVGVAPTAVSSGIDDLLLSRDEPSRHRNAPPVKPAMKRLRNAL